ncbi:hypothetical protein niasHT_033284 [Heterodera trifolii]|uniref:Uncharacterized protein n=1 Tax=Heterodera trifolii TaxID=157864 RepID=A0ABD2I458_9BILA
MLMKMLVLFVLNSLLVLIVSAEIGTQQTAKAVQITGSLGQCLLEIKPRICDTGNVLSEEDRTKLDTLLAKVEEGTKREGYPLKIKTKSCGHQGITLQVIQLKAAPAEDMDTLQTQLLQLLQEYTEAHPCMRIAFIVLNADDDKVENRRFWCGVNWNVPVKPSEIVELYRNEISLVVKAEYGHALNNIADKFLAMASKRLEVPFDELPVVNANINNNNSNTQPLVDGTVQQQNTVEVQGEKAQPAEQQVEEQSENRGPEQTQSTGTEAN